MRRLPPPQRLCQKAEMTAAGAAALLRAYPGAQARTTATGTGETLQLRRALLHAKMRTMHQHQQWGTQPYGHSPARCAGGWEVGMQDQETPVK